MFTAEQREKAEKALRNNSVIDSFEKEIAFANHTTALEWVDTYNLPYRIALNHIKTPDKEHVSINPCYPFPGYKKSDLIHVPIDDCLMYNPEEPPREENGKTLHYLNMTPKEADTRQQIAEHNKALRPWDLSTQEGKRKWEYYFAHFLSGADLQTYQCFDYFGRRTAAKGDTDRINYWKSLQADYHLSPDRYMKAGPLLTDYNLEEYTHWYFICDWNESTDQKGM